MQSSLYGILLPHSSLAGARALVEYLAVFYAAVVTLLLVRLLARHIALHRALRHVRKAPDAAQALFQEKGLAVGVRNCRLLVLPGIATPATIGILRPRILLPELFEEAGNFGLLHDVVTHELAHVARHDYTWAAFADLAECFLFFHPAIWMARKQLLVQRELACDLAVVGAEPNRRADYAQCLTTFARMQMLAESAPLGVDFAGGAGFLGLRVRAILAGPSRSRLPSRLVRAGMVTALTIAFALLCPLLVIWVAASPEPGVTTLNAGAPVSFLSHSNRAHRSRTAKASSGPAMAPYVAVAPQAQTAGTLRPAIFPPDGALSDESFSASSISLATDDTPADVTGTARLGRTPSQLPVPGSPARSSVTRNVLDNLGRLLASIDRDPRPRVHR